MPASGNQRRPDPTRLTDEIGTFSTGLSQGG
jgi:hypothetical protein